MPTNKCIICGKEFTPRNHCVTCGAEACKMIRKSQVMTARWADRRNMKTCEICAREFQCPPSDKTVTCSPECRAEKFRRQALTLHTKHIKRCVCCGREFADSPSNKRVTCRRKGCTSWAHRQSANPDYEAMKRGIAASPLLQPDERHVNARDWSLVAPDGTVYQFRNLRHFIRQRQELFTAEELQLSGRNNPAPLASFAFGKLRPGVMNQVESWHGWKWAHGHHSPSSNSTCD